MKITNEIKANLFAMYLGGNVKIRRRLHYSSDNSIHSTEDYFVDFDILTSIKKGRHESINIGLMDDKIILKPLSAITIIEATELLAMRFPGEKIKDVVVVPTSNKIYYRRKLQYSWQENTVDITGPISFSMGQFLQSRGYDLPQYLLNNKTLQEVGLACYE